MMQLRPQDQYRDYLIRYAEAGPPYRAPALTYDEFCAALELWDREYHTAWTRNDVPQMNRLEHMLSLERTALMDKGYAPFKDISHA